MGIRSIFSDSEGTKIAFIDDHNQGYIFNPVITFFIIFRLGIYFNIYYNDSIEFQADEEPLMINNFPNNCSKILWDSSRTRTFAVFENKMCVTYVYTKYSINGKFNYSIIE